MTLSPLFWTLSLLAVSIGMFLAAAARAQARLKRQYPPIGQMVDIGGYRLHLHVAGKGKPTVILDSGAGGIVLAWELIRPPIAKVTRQPAGWVRSPRTSKPTKVSRSWTA